MHLDDFSIDTICAGCDLFAEVNDLGLCDACYDKLERDLIRERAWDYSALAFSVAPEHLETLREQIIRDYGPDYELIASTPKPRKRKNKRSNSRNSQRKRQIAANAIRQYTTDDVLQAAQAYLQARDETWVNFSRLAQHLYETFYKLKPKRLGEPGKKYKSILKFIQDYPDQFELRQDDEKKGVYWIRPK